MYQIFNKFSLFQYIYLHQTFSNMSWTPTTMPKLFLEQVIFP